MYKLGKQAPKLDARTLKLAPYLKALPPAPSRCNWSTKANNITVLLNDQIGNCGLVTPANLIKCWTAENDNPVNITDTDVLKAYQDVGRYVIGDPTTDNGIMMLDGMNYWRQTGIGGHTIEGYVALDIHKREHFKQTIHKFGGAALGFALPRSVESQKRWTVLLGGELADGTKVDITPNSWGGHAVSAHAYIDEGGPDDGVLILSWGERFWVSWAFLNAYCDEGYAVLSRDWADFDGAPSGFPFDQLRSDIALVAG